MSLRYRFMVQIREPNGDFSLLRVNRHPIDGRRWILVPLGSRATHFPDAETAETEASAFRRHNTGWGTKVIDDLTIPADPNGGAR